MDSDRIAVIDLETTGLSPWRHDRVVEIAIVVMSAHGSVLTEYETLVNPNRDVGPSRIHQISAADVRKAPTFAEIAGDVLQVLAEVNVVAGHNVSFDMNFLIKEYERIGALIPAIPLLCTCRLFGRNNLKACCEELGIFFDGAAHRALSDARATARIVASLCADDFALLDGYRFAKALWPSIPALRKPCVCRESARQIREEPPRFLERIVSKARHDVEADAPNLLAYMTLVDRVLEDRMIDQGEENTLVDAAEAWRLSVSQLEAIHRQYVHSLAVAALTDGVVTASERNDLHRVSKLLGQDDSMLDTMLDSAIARLISTHGPSAPTQNDNDLRGRRVCFTGELQSTISGQAITRGVAEALTTRAGLIVASNVTKSLDILVVADPHTQSSKATKARAYGIRILSDTVFWRLIGVTVD